MDEFNPAADSDDVLLFPFTSSVTDTELTFPADIASPFDCDFPQTTMESPRPLSPLTSMCYPVSIARPVVSAVVITTLNGKKANAPATSSRRAQHRLLDIERRKREQTAMNRLQQLVGEEHPPLDKVGILNAAIKQIERLKRRTHDDDDVQTNEHEKRQRRELVQQELSASAAAGVLNNELFLVSLFRNSRVMEFVIDVDSGFCLSVNDIFTHFGGIAAQNLIGRMCIPQRSEYFLESARNNWSGFGPQWPTNINDSDFRQEMVALYRGRVSTFDVIFTIFDRDCNQYQARRRYWLSSHQPLHDDNNTINNMTTTVSSLPSNTLLHTVTHIIPQT